MQNISEIQELIKLISKLPGLGPRSAKRIVLKMINNREELIKPMAKNLVDVYKNISRCKACGSLKSNSKGCSNCENINNKYITNYGFSIIYKWHPYEFTKNISFSLFQKGLSESGFDPMIRFYSNFKYKGIILNTGISHGGYLDNYKIYFILSNKNQNISIGTYNIEGVFNNWKSVSTFLNLTTYF